MYYVFCVTDYVMGIFVIVYVGVSFVSCFVIMSGYVLSARCFNTSILFLMSFMLICSIMMFCRSVECGL